MRALLAEEDATPVLMTRRIFRSPQMRFLNSNLPGAAPRIAETDEWREIAVGTRYIAEHSTDISQPLFLIERQTDGVLSATQFSPFDAEGESVIAAIMKDAAPFSPTVDAGASSPTAHLTPPTHHGLHLSVGKASSPLTLKLERIQYPLLVRFTNGVELIGYSLPINAALCDMAGQYLPLTLYLRHTDAAASGDEDALIFLHLMLPDMQLQDNGPLGAGFPLPLWRSDDIVDDRRGFSLPTTLTPGKAFFETGLFWLSDDGEIRRGEIVDDQARIGSDQIVLGALQVCNGVTDVSFDGLAPVGADFEGRIALDGVSIQQPLDAPATLQVELGWRAIDRSPMAYTAFIHLLDATDSIVTQYDFLVGGADNPTNLWVPGEKVRSTIALMLPPDFDPTQHRLRIGLYEPASGRQLPVTMSGDAKESTYILLNVNE